MPYPLQQDFDMVDYVNELRDGCLEAYTGIIQGLKGDEKQANGETTSPPLPDCSVRQSYIPPQWRSLWRGQVWR